MTFRAVAVLCAVVLQAQTNPAESEIRAARRASNEALRRHDLKAFASSLDGDFLMVRGNGTLTPSRQAYLDLFAADFENRQAIGYERVADRVDISTAAPLAAEHGHWIGTYRDGRRAYSGTYLAMWRKTDGGWKLRSELFVVLSCEDAQACAAYRKP